MKLTVTQHGVLDDQGREIPVGGVITVAGDIIPDDLKGKVLEPALRTPDPLPIEAVTPEVTPAQKGPFIVGQPNSGWYPILNADLTVVKQLRKDAADAFEAMSADDRLTFMGDQKS